MEAVIKREPQKKGKANFKNMMQAVQSSKQSNEDSAENIENEEELGDQRIVPLEEIQSIYKTLKLRPRHFTFSNEGDIIPDEPFIDIQNEMLTREMRPGCILLSDSGKKAKLHKLPTDDIPFLYEFNQYNELVVFCAIEARQRLLKDQINKNKDQ